MLDNVAIRVLWPSIRILRITSDPVLRNHKLGMSHSSRSNFETSPLELVLSIDFSEVFPLRRFTVASRSGLRDQLDQAYSKQTYRMVRHLLRNIPVPIRDGVFE